MLTIDETYVYNRIEKDLNVYKKLYTLYFHSGAANINLFSSYNKEEVYRIAKEDLKNIFFARIKAYITLNNINSIVFIGGLVEAYAKNAESLENDYNNLTNEAEELKIVNWRIITSYTRLKGYQEFVEDDDFIEEDLRSCEQIYNDVLDTEYLEMRNKADIDEEVNIIKGKEMLEASEKSSPFPTTLEEQAEQDEIWYAKKRKEKERLESIPITLEEQFRKSQEEQAEIWYEMKRKEDK